MNDMMNGNHREWGMGWGMWFIPVVIILAVAFVLYQKRGKK
jgi:hypothetical protein